MSEHQSIPVKLWSRRQLLKAFSSVVAIPSTILLSSCSQPKSLKFGVHPWIGYEPFYLARDTHLIPEDIEVIHFANQSEKNPVIIAGDLDAMTLSFDEVLQLRAMGIPLTVITVLNISAGADMVIAKVDAQGRTLLKPGVRLAYEANSIGVLMLMMTLEKLGLQKHDVILVPLAVGEPQKQAWLKNQIDAAITYEPFASELIRMGCQVHLTSRDLPRLIYDVLAVRTDRMIEMREQIKQLVAAYFHALEHFVVYQDDSLYRMATRQNLSFAEAQTALQGIVIPGRELNARLLKPQSEFEVAAKAVNRLLYKEGILAAPDSLTNIWSDQFLE